jgi:hypothetical protein
MVQSAFDRPEPKHTPNETNDAESDDEFHDAHFPADEEAVRARPSQHMTELITRTETVRRIEQLQSRSK